MRQSCGLLRAVHAPYSQVHLHSSCACQPEQDLSGLLLLQVDPRMMAELREIQAAVQPSDTLLVVDAMTGQEAAGLVKAFNEAAEITGAHALPSSPFDRLGVRLCDCMLHALPGWFRPSTRPQRSQVRAPDKAIPDTAWTVLLP
jgi:hypothetical protein